MTLQLVFRPYSFALSRPLVTSRGSWQRRRGWLLRIVDPGSGLAGWGEVSPLDPGEQRCCERVISAWCLHVCRSSEELEALLPSLPAALAFAIGAALAELDGVVGDAHANGQRWRPPPRSAQLLPAGHAMPAALEALLAQHGEASGESPMVELLTLKWKVAAAEPALEWRLLSQLLKRLPAKVRLRLDANGGWDRATADRWADAVEGDPRLDWLEQPLAADDLEGLSRLGERVPVALDESLGLNPELREYWTGWQVRRPVLEGDPRPLLQDLQRGRPKLMLSTAFETGIGARWLALLAQLQQQGPTPVAPGLAPGWTPSGPLFASQPEQVWAHAAEARP
ncbi:O-succinylbenzoate synthase [Synechococcus sp. MEDNS5]|uniref:o-succinylbenzoate synthase n=1 Tax=Synechococcus sp. MEDNS5 TaxID=1442554 RepID=UPI001645D924|nr:o-succinylbenzoate synthase [Synechococcus sp. MEDNS5]QNJ07246.1 O-succinylbenzoate synthase [Synechococcus sp. MEDNS5]